jgi:hypothetical protein
VRDGLMCGGSLPSDSRGATTDGSSPQQPRDRSARRRGEVIYLRSAASKPRAKRHCQTSGDLREVPEPRRALGDISCECSARRPSGSRLRAQPTPFVRVLERQVRELAGGIFG